MNPENKCAKLWNKEVPQLENEDQMLKKMFEMQNSLQLRLGQDFSKMNLDERVSLIKENWTALTSEYVELLERLPWKPWKKYSEEQKKDWTSEEQKLETYYEVCDMMHFMINICLLVGVDAETMWKLYYTKNAENFARQDRGY
jgi:hypothetical protein